MTVIVVTGIQAAGKSTVAQALAERLERSVHLRGGLFRRMIVNGRPRWGRRTPAEVLRQLRLRGDPRPLPHRGAGPGAHRTPRAMITRHVW